MNDRFTIRISNDPRSQRFFRDMEKLDKSKWSSKADYVLTALDEYRSNNKTNNSRRITREEIAEVVREVIREELQDFFNSGDETDEGADEEPDESP